ncbi:putative phage abortive infection protein [Leptospira sanjuanensis]|uniref:putative phage abortive infection protein n=1 Tax=Leptospira sanjuanensis TaxID=2879643 RepID=UPI001EE8D462|nr:putative phage abortive infection protein [Leptospira sanjuanensis]MCG6170158.1 putative phage abortive infection protein [Leptospira sanjuanensis]
MNHQIRASELQNFQNKLFEMIEFHRENVGEFQLGRFKGRSIFIPMLREYRILLRIVKKEIERLHLIYNNEEVVNISYLIFFYGVGKTSTKILTNALARYPKFLIKKLVIKLQNPKTIKKVRKKSKLSYIPFQGHQSRLGHYYRNLYAIVKFVHYQRINIDKYEYVRNIRSQLSNHEQALLLINIISDIGLTWKKEFFLEKYRLVRNIPKGFFNESKEFDPTHYLPAKYMEYNDIEILRAKIG